MDFLMRGLPAAFFMAAALLAGCDREFESPFLPDSEGYAGTAWSRDDDGDGVADSVEKYAPGCGAGPGECLKKARANAESARSSGLESIEAENMSLVEGGPAVAPRLRWYPEGLTGVAYTLASDDPKVAAPLDDKVRPGTAGSTLFTLTARDATGTERTARFRVTVTAIPVRVTGVAAEDIRMRTGETRIPPVRILPPEATDPRFELLTHDPLVISVRNGMLVAEGPGKALATVRTLDGRHEAIFAVTVHQPLSGLSASSFTLRQDGQPRAPALQFSPANASDKGYTLSGGDPLVAVPTADGQRVRPVGPGVTRLTATAEGGIAAAFTVTVEAVRVPVRDVRVKDMEFSLLAGSGAPARLPEITWIPADASEKGYTLVVKDPEIARVAGGAIEPLRGGETKATLFAHDGGKKAEFKVEVKILIGCGGLLDTCGGKDGGGGGDDDDD
jgi:hypothetical protein